MRVELEGVRTEQRPAPAREPVGGGRLPDGPTYPPNLGASGSAGSAPAFGEGGRPGSSSSCCWTGPAGARRGGLGGGGPGGPALGDCAGGGGNGRDVNAWARVERGIGVVGQDIATRRRRPVAVDRGGRVDDGPDQRAGHQRVRRAGGLAVRCPGDEEHAQRRWTGPAACRPPARRRWSCNRRGHRAGNRAGAASQKSTSSPTGATRAQEQQAVLHECRARRSIELAFLAVHSTRQTAVRSVQLRRDLADALRLSRKHRARRPPSAPPARGETNPGARSSRGRPSTRPVSCRSRSPR